MALFVTMGCEETPLVFEPGEVQLVNFTSSSANLGVLVNSSSSVQVPFTTSSTSSESRTFNVTINEEASNIVPGSVTLGSAVVPADSYEGVLTIDGTDVGLAQGDTRSYVISFAEENGVATDGELTVNVFLVCPFTGDIGSAHEGSGVAFNAATPTWAPTLTPVDGQENTWTIDSAWGPNFVAWATGNGGFAGQYLYSGTITVDPDDLSATLVGDDAWATGGTGRFDPCTNSFQMTLRQGLFTNAFTVDVVIQGN